MLQSTEGIITRTVKYGESSMILDLLTSENGIQSFIIGGIRKKGGKNRTPLIQVLNIVRVEAYIKGADKLSRIKEISYSYIYQTLPFDVLKASIATFLIEVCRKAAKASDDFPRLYHFIVKGLIHLDQTPRDFHHFHIRFLLKMAKILGFEMTNNYGPATPIFDLRDGTFIGSRVDHRLHLDEEVSQAMHRYLKDEDFEDIPRQLRQHIVDAIVDFYDYHLEEFGTLKSLEVLKALYGN